MSDQRIKLAVVGLNNQGQEHLLAAPLLKHCEIVAVCDTNPEALANAQALFSSLKGYQTIDELLENAEFDALVLALPHHVYPRIWKQMVSTGKPLLKEKPLGRTFPEAFSFVYAAKDNECYLQTAIQRRSQPSYVYLREYLKEVECLSISLMMHLGFDPERDGAGWRGESHQAGGGVVLDYGYHGIDLLFFLLGSVELVSASLWRGDRPATAQCLESEARVVLRSGSTWIHLDLMVGGEPDASRPSGFKKQELITIDSEKGCITANRSGVWLNGEALQECDRDWKSAMATQLDDFAIRVKQGNVDHDCVWEQIPAMRVIERIYSEAGMVWPLPPMGEMLVGVEKE